MQHCGKAVACSRRRTAASCSCRRTYITLVLLRMQAFCNKYFGGRNALIFAPQQLRELDVELQSELEPRFADLAGGQAVRCGVDC